MKKILLINPSSTDWIYRNTNVKSATLSSPPLSLPLIAAPLLKEGYDVKIIDLDLSDQNLKDQIQKFNPDYVGITGSTPLFYEIIRISKIVKEIDQSIKIIVGGVHATIVPYDFLNSNLVDIVAYGEADFTLLEILKSKKLEDVKGIYFKKDKKIIKTPPRELIKNLDILPFPSWELIDVKKYKSSYLSSKKNPVGPMETSRGCVFGCVYCNKDIFGRMFRSKTYKRVVDEFEYTLNQGFKEIHICDDGFSTDMERAKKICDEIIKRKLDFSWSLFNGIRVDKIDDELAEKLKKAGCYQIAFGIESGNQDILNKIQKGVTLEQVRQAIKISKKAGLETFGFFMFGLPGETEKTMQDTINFAKELDMDLSKFDITIPYPGTKLYNDLEKEGKILSKNWSDYIVHQDNKELFKHSNLSFATIHKYYKKSFRSYYLRPSYIYKRFFKSFKKGELTKDIKSLLETKW